MTYGTGLVVVVPGQIRPKRTSGLFKNYNAALDKVAAGMERVTSIDPMLHRDKEATVLKGQLDAELAERRDGFLRTEDSSRSPSWNRAGK